MIKKIDANEYGVVKYAITSVDELNRLPKKIAPSSQAILIENGLRVFVYGDGQWVEEVVDGDLSENMRSIVADYERSKMGYDGVKRGSLEERLKDDFQGIYDILNARDYCEYSGKELKVDNTWMGNQIDTRVEGRTLRNLIDDSEYKKIDFALYSGTTMEENEEYFILNRGNELKCSLVLQKKLLKPNTKYTLILSKKDVNTEVQIYDVVKETFLLTKSNITRGVFTTLDTLDEIRLYFLNSTDMTLNSIKVYKNSITILEGDHTQTPLSELPYFEGIESVGEREIGKNLLDPSELEYGYIVNGVEVNNEEYNTNRKRSGFMKVKPNTNYVFSSNLNEFNTNWWFYDINKEYISKEVYSQTTTTPSNCEYIRVHNGHTDGTSLSDFKLQVEEGAVATEYEPFGYKIKGKSYGKNLINPKKVKVNTGTSINVIDDNTFEVSIDDSWGGIIFDNIELKAGKKYTLTYDCENDLVLPYIKRKENGAYGNTMHYGRENPVVITPTDDITVRISITSKEAIGRAIIKNIILTESDDISYEPYQESTYSIHSPIPLRSLPNGVCDIYDFESGAVIQKVGKIVLDGSEEGWSTSPVAGNGFKRYLLKFSSYQVGQVEAKPMCSINDKIFNRTTEGHGDYEYLYIQYSDKSMEAYYQILEDKASSVDNFKLWLQANPTTVYYELKEPIIHYLTPSQLKSFDGTTHVISENTLIPTTTTKILTSTYANVSNVNSTTYSLRRGVNDVAETSAVINETDVEQDDVLDITMCAIDELYSMLEPNLE